MSLFAELRRRNVFRVAAAYGIVAWLLAQVASLISPQLQLPGWAPTLVTLLLLLGFPVALIVAWAFELTPDGIRLSNTDASNETAGRSGIVDYGLIGGLILVAAITLRGQFQPASEPSAQARDSTPSIAVMPFADMSPNADQGYFGDGIAEELLNELTRLEGLDVAGRMSSFAFKGSNETLRAIGEALSVGTVLEGSVRKDGDTIRITAQLIDVDSGFHLWSQTYTRDLADIFAIQEEIAATVAGELGVRLGVGDVNAFRGAGTRNVDAYETYLRGVAAIDENEQLRLLDRAIELDPGYAAAWAERGIAVASTIWDGPVEQAPQLIDQATQFIERAVELDPESADAHAMLGTMYYGRFDWREGQAEHQRALNLGSTRSSLVQHGNMLLRAGRLEAARIRYEAAAEVEPLDMQSKEFPARTAISQRRYAAARQLAASAGDPDLELEIAINEGDDEMLRSVLAAFPREPVAKSMLYQRVLAAYDSRGDVVSLLEVEYGDSSTQWPSKRHDIAMMAAYFGAPELALEAKRDEAQHAPVRLYAVWYPVMSAARQLPQFKQFVRDVNLVDYWREYGWADLCSPVDAVDFVCD